MQLATKIVEFLEPASQGRRVRRVLIGLGYTGVQLDDGGAGVAYTMGRSDFSGCSVFMGKRPLAGAAATDLLQFLGSPRVVESSVGLATANALNNRTPDTAATGDVLKAVNLLPSDRVTMVGFFGPLAAGIRERTAELVICDERLDATDGFLPASQASREVARSDVALITATALLNGSIDELLEAARGCRETVLLGPSTPMIPECFAGGPATCLSGVTVKDPDGLFQVLAEGGGTRLFMPYMTKWNIRPPRD